jgi:hypothetical protein
MEEIVMALNSRAKGASGEREFCRYIEKLLRLNYTPQRNLEQVREGGADIMDIPPFCIEVKRCQRLSLRDWWIQVNRATTDTNPVPFVAFRPNNQPWRFLISAKYIDLEKGFIQLEEHEFKQWIRKYYLKYLEYANHN